MLNQAKAHRNRINHFELKNAGMNKDQWLAVVGVGAQTRVRLNIGKKDRAPAFLLHSSDRQNKWSDGKNDQERQLTGDGKAPYAGALPPFFG